MSYTRMRKWLITRGIRKRVTLDDHAAKAIADLELSHLGVMAKAARRLGRNTDGAIVNAVFPILSRNQDLPKQLASLPRHELRKTAEEVIGLHSSATELADRDGTIDALSTTLYDQIAALLITKLPSGYTLLRDICVGELKHALVKGWNPQVAGSIFLHRFVGNPRQYIYLKTDPDSLNRSAAPYRVSSSPVQSQDQFLGQFLKKHR